MRIKKITVLLVDDEPIDVDVMRRTLEARDYSVLEADGYEEALEVFRRHSEIDILVSDISLPGQNGIELARVVLSERPFVKILLTSGWAGAELIQFSGIPNLEGFFLPKPFGSAELLSAVDRALNSPDSQTLFRASGAQGGCG